MNERYRRKLEAQRRWRAEHPDRQLESQRKWIDANREHVNDYQRRYRADHPEFAARQRQKSRSYRETHREQCRRGVNRWTARKRAESWLEQGRSFTDYADYAANAGAPVPMSEENFNMTMEFLTEMRKGGRP